MTANNNSVVFIAFEERENLGVRYMASVLIKAGYRIRVLDFRLEKAKILEELGNVKPFLVGISVIFEEHIDHFRDLIEYLRENGIQGHFTAGGHYASLQYEALFNMTPSLDSIVSFEGEHTILELANQLHSGKTLDNIKGVIFRSNGEIRVNDLRPLEKDIDIFPYPLRSEIKEYAVNKKYVTILAGRGCIHNCVYCNIGEFYRLPPGPVKRIRDPFKVVEEMEQMYLENNCSIFLFQDDDFPFTTPGRPNWIEDFCRALDERSLVGKIMWKVNCRPDEIDRERVEMMKKHGLFRIYLGIEDGTDSGLQKINKKQSVSQIIHSVQIVKDLGIGLDYGFMLFQPFTTYTSLKKNLDFLESICGDGYMSVAFLKMLPYFGTRIEKNLRSEGRLIGRPGFLDYDLRDKSLNDYHHFIFDRFHHWLNDPGGFTNLSQWATDYLSVYSFYYGDLERIQKLSHELRTKVSGANQFMVDTMRTLLEEFKTGGNTHLSNHYTKQIQDGIVLQHDKALEVIVEIIRKIQFYTLSKSLIGG